MTKTKRYTILQKKLKELESELKQVFSFPPDNVFNVQNNELYSQDIEQKILFLKGLLTAEISSSPKKPRHLEHIGKRLLHLETAFHEWNQIISTASYKDHLTPTVPACSCTHSCLNDDISGSDSIEEISTSPSEELFDGLKLVNKEKESEAVTGVDEEEKAKVVVFERGEGDGFKFYWGLLGGVVIGIGVMGFVMLRLCPYMNQTSCAIAPT